MKLIFSGISHEFIGEPTPRQLHEICTESAQPPAALELYMGELEHLYKANGWQLAGILITRRQVQLHEVMQQLEVPPHVAVASLGSSALLGPVAHNIMSEYVGMHGISLWVPAVANQAVALNQITVN